MTRSKLPQFVENEPSILTVDSLPIANGLSAKPKEERDTAIIFLPADLKDMSSFKARLNKERQRCLLGRNDEPLSIRKLQHFEIIEQMLAHPEMHFAQAKRLEKIPPPNITAKHIEKLSVSENDIAVFLNYYKNWSPNIRKIIEQSNNYFWLSPNGNSLFDSTEKDSHGIVLTQHNDSAKGIAISIRYINNLRTSQIKYDATQFTAVKTVIGRGPSSIDWQAALREIKRADYRNTYALSRAAQSDKFTDDAAVGLVMSVVGKFVHETNERTAERSSPLAYKAYKQYMSYINSIANQIHFIDPDTIERPEILLLHNKNSPDTNREPIPPGGDIPSPTPSVTVGDAVPPDNLIKQTEQFVWQCLREQPPISRFQCHLSLQSGHPIVLTLKNHENTQTRQLSLMPNQPDLQQAIELKQRIQTHVLNMPGIISYRKPIVGAEYHLGWEDIIPDMSPQQVRLVKANGVFKIELHFNEADQPIVMGFSLGLRQDEQNRQQAEQRRDIVMAFLDERRAVGRRVTKGDAVQSLRARIPEAQWQSSEKMDVEGYPAGHKEITIPFPAADSGQSTVIRVNNLHIDGDPNPAWKVSIDVLPNNIFPIGLNLNLHTLDESIAQERANEVINALLEQFRNLPANAQWAVDETNMLLRLTPAALGTTPNVDATRLRDMLDDLPHYKDDLAAKIIQQQQDGDTINFTVGIIRGANIGINERVMEKIGTDPLPVRIERHFSVPVNQASNIQDFERAVNDTFQGYLREEYRPRTDQSLEKDGIAKRKTSLAYNPKTAPVLLDDAIQTQLERLKNFPKIHNSDPPRISGGKGKWRESIQKSVDTALHR